MKLGISYMVFDGEELLEYAIRSIRKSVDYVSVIYQKISYFGNISSPDQQSVLDSIKQKGLIDDLILYESNLDLHYKQNELNIRNFGLDKSIENKCTHHISADVDEFYLPDQLNYAKKIMDSDYDCSLAYMKNYYKRPDYVIYPDQGHHSSFIHPVSNRYSMTSGYPHGIEYTRRHERFANCKLFTKEEMTIHHMTFVRKNIRLKLRNSSNGLFCNVGRICSEFDKYQLGEPLRVPPDLKPRTTILGENLFNIGF